MLGQHQEKLHNSKLFQLSQEWLWMNDKKAKVQVIKKEMWKPYTLQHYADWVMDILINHPEVD